MIPATADDWRREARRLAAVSDARRAAGDHLGADAAERRSLLARKAAELAAFRAIGGGQ